MTRRLGQTRCAASGNVDRALARARRDPRRLARLEAAAALGPRLDDEALAELYPQLAAAQDALGRLAEGRTGTVAIEV
jgi:hypothetical protein